MSHAGGLNASLSSHSSGVHSSHHLSRLSGSARFSPLRLQSAPSLKKVHSISEAVRGVEISGRALLPPELERAKHATEDVDTPLVSPRESPTLSPRHSMAKTTFEDIAL